MTALTLCLLAGALLSAAAGGLLFVGAVRAGQLDDVEEAKFRMLREDENR
ncbi:MAG: cbb3-type cytochrome oxidase assembly protein CcoS [Myxococcaceae bacterium]